MAHAEQELETRFPDAFERKMMDRNGDEVSIDGEAWWLFPFRDPTDRKSLSRTAEDITRATRAARADGLGFPEDGVAIAHNAAGDLVLLQADGDGSLGCSVWVFRLRGGELSLALGGLEELRA